MAYTATSHRGAIQVIWCHCCGGVSRRPSLFTVCGADVLGCCVGDVWPNSVC